MNLATRFEQVTVIGAAGKMGSGIALLLAVEMAKRRLAAKAPEASYHLHLVDVSEQALRGLAEYLRTQSKKSAEKMVTQLKPLYADRADIVENVEIIDEFVADVQRTVTFTTDVAAAKSSHLVFEAIVENEDVKLVIYKRLAELCSRETWFFTNTSSIPIHVLDEKAGLEGRIIGYHFYNPPAVQKLVELITSPRTRPELIEDAQEIGKVLKKILIPANDVAGFIGNGHFTRDGLHALAEVERLQKDGMSQVEAIYAVNRVSQELMVRPMGIFQLIDYVGIDVFQLILTVMSRYLPKAGLHSSLIDTFVAKGVKGGQFPNGSQKDGFLKYEKGGPSAVYDLGRGAYLALDKSAGGWCTTVDQKLGAPPLGCLSWKAWMAQPNRAQTLLPYLDRLWQTDTLGARLARAFLVRSAEIAENLVKDGVAKSVEDVNGVLENGFFHAYGPVNEVTKKRLADSLAAGGRAS